jgi:hypothetical protein
MFLERRSYRVRRLMDAVRLLPLLGLALWMVPLLWPVSETAASDGAGAMPLSLALQYIFGIWVLLVLAAWALWRRTREQASKNDVPNAGAD